MPIDLIIDHDLYFLALVASIQWKAPKKNFFDDTIRPLQLGILKHGLDAVGLCADQPLSRCSMMMGVEDLS
jgi:hypothetical protein